MRRVTQILNHFASIDDNGLAAEPTASLLPLGRIVETEKTGGDLVAEILKSHGVKYIFTLVGGHISPILVSAKREGIKVIDVRHEVTTVYAADGVARLTGVPGVAAVTAGPGITNTITAVKNAQMAQSPVILLGGAAATMLKGRGALQDIDQMALLQPICKFCATCASVADIAPTLRRAFQEAQSGVPGPVFVELPLDILYPVNEMRAAMGLVDRLRARDINKDNIGRVLVPEDAKQKSVADYVASKQPSQPVFLSKDASSMSGVVKAALNYKLAQVFAGAHASPTVCEPLPVTFPLPSSSQIQSSVTHLLEAKNPVLVVASQAMLGGIGQTEKLQQAILALGIPTFLGGMARGLLGQNSPLHIRQGRGKAFKRADLILLVGAVADFRLDYGRAIPKQAKVITVNRSSQDGTMNAGRIVGFWNPSMVCEADPYSYLINLSQAYNAQSGAAKNKAAHAEWARVLKDNEAKVEAANSKKANEVAMGRGANASKRLINPISLFEKLEKILPQDSILVADGGDIVATASYVVRPRGPLCWMDPGAFGTLGVGGGFALAAKLCRPASQVWLIWGDGSSAYSLAEYDTFKRHNLPVIGLIGNDACWTQIEREQIPMFQDDVACPLEYTRYDVVSQGYGAKGLEVGDESQVEDVLRAAQKIAETDAVVVNCYVGDRKSVV